MTIFARMDLFHFGIPAFFRGHLLSPIYRHACSTPWGFSIICFPRMWPIFIPPFFTAFWALFSCTCSCALCLCLNQAPFYPDSYSYLTATLWHICMRINFHLFKIAFGFRLYFFFLSDLVNQAMRYAFILFRGHFVLEQ